MADSADGPHYDVGAAGVNLVSSPIHKPEGSLLEAQNVERIREDGIGGLGKRGGLSKFNLTSLEGEVLAVVTVPLLSIIDIGGEPPDPNPIPAAPEPPDEAPAGDYTNLLIPIYFDPADVAPPIPTTTTWLWGDADGNQLLKEEHLRGPGAITAPPTAAMAGWARIDGIVYFACNQDGDGVALVRPLIVSWDRDESAVAATVQPIPGTSGANEIRQMVTIDDVIWMVQINVSGAGVVKLRLMAWTPSGELGQQQIGQVLTTGSAYPSLQASLAKHQGDYFLGVGSATVAGDNKVYRMKGPFGGALKETWVEDVFAQPANFSFIAGLLAFPGHLFVLVQLTTSHFEIWERTGVDTYVKSTDSATLGFASGAFASPISTPWNVPNALSKGKLWIGCVGDGNVQTLTYDGSAWAVETPPGQFLNALIPHGERLIGIRGRSFAASSYDGVVYEVNDDGSLTALLSNQPISFGAASLVG